MGDVLAEYEHGAGAPLRAAALGWARVGGAAGVILVEGVSDQIAVETAARVMGQALGGVVVPIGGAHAIGKAVLEVRRRAPEAVVAGLCDRGEEAVFLRAAPDHPAFRTFVCDADLEDELVGAAGPELVERVMAEQGDLAAFRTLQSQPSWRGGEHRAQVRRFVGAGARRKHRYAAAIVEALGAGRIPAPIVGAIAYAGLPSVPGAAT